jgi:hypothetical protein
MLNLNEGEHGRSIPELVRAWLAVFRGEPNEGTSWLKARGAGRALMSRHPNSGRTGLLP